MITALKVEHFQSLHDIELELGGITVIVGPSSSGKSALMRAIRTLISNPRGSSFIEHGETEARIEVQTHQGSLELKRSTNTAKNAYEMFDPSPHTDQDIRTFTKLGGEVPPEVSQFLGIDAKDPIQIASQFDMPYMLTDSAQEVARVLGGLTNVSVIFDAAREANRQKLAIGTELRLRQADLDGIKAQLPAIKTLKARREALEVAEEYLEHAKQVSVKQARLEQLWSTKERADELVARTGPVAEQKLPSLDRALELREQIKTLDLRITQLRNAEDRAELYEHDVAMELPSLDAANKIRQRLRALDDLLNQLNLSKVDLGRIRANLDEATQTMAEAEQERLDVLHEAGQCPTCGQSTTELSHH